jgi:hypothetical protein
MRYESEFTFPLTDKARWTGIRMRSHDVGARKMKGGKPRDRYTHNGVHYRTASECMLAKLLARQKVDFTPNVRFVFKTQDGQRREFVPDFIFNRQAYVWTGSKKHKPLLIHGIEAKGRTRNGKFSERAWENIRLLRHHHGIVVLLLSNEAIQRFWRQGWLPLAAFRG